jgi:hypothetical protein
VVDLQLPSSITKWKRALSAQRGILSNLIMTLGGLCGVILHALEWFPQVAPHLARNNHILPESLATTTANEWAKSDS